MAHWSMRLRTTAGTSLWRRNDWAASSFALEIAIEVAHGGLEEPIRHVFHRDGGVGPGDRAELSIQGLDIWVGVVVVDAGVALADKR